MRRWDPERLAELLAPRSLAIVGASERSVWAASVLSALEQAGYAGRVEFVNGRGGKVFGRDALERLSDLAEPVDLAYVMVPRRAVLPVLREAVEVGVRNAVVLSSGFAEMGEQGAAAQRDITSLAEEGDLAVLGPNTLGFVNTTSKLNLQPNMLPAALPAGPVSLVSQSGYLNASMFHYCYSHAIGLSKVVGVGNEAVVDAADMVGYLAEDPDTQAIGVFLETIRRPDQFIAALELARARAKPVVVLKVGKHEVAARVAAAHTGAFVGDDRVVDAVLRQHGAIRVDSLEELVTTAGVVARTGPLDGNRLAVVGLSGGVCDIVADQAIDVGLDLPSFSEEAKASLEGMLPDLGAVNNPLDVTGAVMSDASLFGRVVGTLGDRTCADVVLVHHDIPNEHVEYTQMFEGVLDRLPALPVPAFVFGAVAFEYPTVCERFGDAGEFIQLGGIERVVTALGHAAWWSSRVRAAEPEPRIPAPPTPGLAAGGDRVGVWSEGRSRALLRDFDVPLVPARHVADETEAVEAAFALGFPVVVKANGDDLAHKTDLGAVELGLSDEDEVRAACERIRTSVGRRPIQGFLVSPMRRQSTELIVGVARTPAWGLVLAVGFGGILTEAVADTSLRRLPVTSVDVAEMLGELEHAALLDGVRGRDPVDKDALVDTILRVADAASFVAEDLEAVEVNPLSVDGERIEALDALVSWRKGASMIEMPEPET